MPVSGRLGATADLAAGADTLIHTVAAGQVATANIRFCNRNATAVKVRLAIGIGANPATADYIEFDQQIAANGVLENTGIVISAGENLWARSDTANVSVRAHGFEEAA